MAYTTREQWESVYYQRKQSYLDYLGGQCVVCGTDEDLEFDHIDWRTKSFTIMKVWGAADQEAVFRELDKCQLLCKEHHKEKTKQDQNEIKTLAEPNHGTMYAWQKQKCQCELCSVARRIWYDRRNEKRRTGARGPYNRRS